MRLGEGIRKGLKNRAKGFWAHGKMEVGGGGRASSQIEYQMIELESGAT